MEEDKQLTNTERVGSVYLCMVASKQSVTKLMGQRKTIFIKINDVFVALIHSFIHT